MEFILKRQTGSAAVLSRNLDRGFSRRSNSSEWRRAAGGAIPEPLFRSPKRTFPDENRNLIPEESSGTKKSQTLVDTTARFALFPLPEPERTTWLSSKKRACVRGVC